MFLGLCSLFLSSSSLGKMFIHHICMKDNSQWWIILKRDKTIFLTQCRGQKYLLLRSGNSDHPWEVKRWDIHDRKSLLPCCAIINKAFFMSANVLFNQFLWAGVDHVWNKHVHFDDRAKLFNIALLPLYRLASALWSRYDHKSKINHSVQLSSQNIIEVFWKKKK